MDHILRLQAFLLDALIRLIVRDDALDVTLGMVARIAKDDYIPVMDISQADREFIDDQAILILKHRQHGRPFNPHRLVKKKDDKGRDDGSNDEICQPRSDACGAD